MKRSPPHTLEGEELDHQKKKEDETEANSQLKSDASVEDHEDVIKVDLPNEPLQSDEAVPKILRYFYNLFNRPLRYDLHRNQDEEFQKKNHPHGVVDLRRRYHKPNQEEDSLKKNRTIVVVPNQTAIQSNQNLVADEEESRNYEKDISGTQSASFKNTSYIVKVLEDRFHENHLIGSQSARCKMTCDKGNLSEREEDSTKTTYYKKGSPISPSLAGGEGRSKKMNVKKLQPRDQK